MLEILQFVLGFLIAFSISIVSFLLARRASENIGKISEKALSLKEEIRILSAKLEDAGEAIEVRDEEIEFLKYKLKEKKEKIAEMKEAIKIAQISERGLRRIEENLGEMRAIVKEMLKTMEEKEKRGKKK